MRRTLRRSCAACAKAKHGCDLQTPKCSRCVERKSSCVYANEPLSSIAGRTPMAGQSSQLATISSRGSKHRAVSTTLSERADYLSPSPLLMAVETQPIDPFDTYPRINLPRARVQGLIYHCTTPRLDILLNPQLTLHSFVQYCLSILPMGYKSGYKSLRHIVVAASTFRSGPVSCLSSNCVA